MKMKMIYQHDEKDCGAACLAMILDSYGLKIPIAKCREMTNTDQDGTSIYGIISGAEKVGVKAEGLSGDVEQLVDGICLGNIIVPFVAHIIKESKQGHFVVVTGVKGNQLTFNDPGKGRRKMTLQEFANCWSGNIVIFTKTEQFVEANLIRGAFAKFFYLLKGQYHKLFTVFILSVLLAFLGIMSAFIFQTIVDEFGVTAGYYEFETEDICKDENCEEEHEHDEGSNIFIDLLLAIDEGAHEYKIFFIGAIVLYLIQGVIQYIRVWLIGVVSRKIDIGLTMSYYERLVKLPMDAISRRKTGEYLSRFGDASVIRDTISSIAITICLDVFMTIASGVLLFNQNKEMFGVTLAIALLYVVIVAVYRKPLEKINRDLMECSADTEAYVKESIDGIETIKTNCAESLIIGKTEQKYRRMTSLAFRETLIAGSQDIMSDMVELIGSVFVMWIGFELVLTNVVTIGSLLSFFILLGYFMSPIKNLIELQPTIQTALIAADRLNDVLDLEEEYDEGNSVWPKDWKNIRFEDIFFQYGNNELLLRDINLQINRGEKIAIVGESGSGKTTLAKVLVRLHDIREGKITIDGKNIESFSLEEIRKNVVYVKQDAYIFAGSVRDNLNMGQVEMTEEMLADASKKSDIETTIMGFSAQYDAYLDEMGQNVSAGQRQRLAIARAILRKPRILILDEAMSNLDQITEENVRNHLMGDKDLTIIMIAHRLATVRACDKIIVMDKGRIVETGSHEELIKKRGSYHSMWGNGE